MLQRKPNYVQPSKQSQSERASERIRSQARWDGQGSDDDGGMCPLKETKGGEKWRKVEWVVSTAHAFCFARCHGNLFFYAFILAHVVTFSSKQRDWT
jgi:hypothetical protein